MCGIAGSLENSSESHDAAVANVRRMVASLEHRGPDDGGVWADAEAGIALGSRRLAIQDLTAAGSQPMRSPSGRYVVALNGEIYNHLDLRTRLADEGADVAWRGHSDTETLAACIDRWGVADALRATIGMFGLAVWDRVARTLSLARDRVGEKPLYLGRCNDLWLFGSELKALLAHPRCTRAIDPAAVSSYMALGYVPAPASIYVGIRKLMPGQVVTLRADGSEHTTTYWCAREAAAQPQLAFASDTDAVDALRDLLRDAVSRQLLSDRPLGAFLSGGVDSTALVALMRECGHTHVKTFSVGFNESSFNEASFAAEIARHFGTDHTELYLDGRDVLDTIHRLPAIYDEPFADMSQVPTHIVSTLAGRHVTVALSGDGGDELFGGYPRYRMGERLWRIAQHVPHPLRSRAGALLQIASVELIDRAFMRLHPNNDVSGLRGLRPAQKLAKLGRTLRSRDIESLYWCLLAPWGDETLQRTPTVRWPTPQRSASTDPDHPVAQDFMLRDVLGYLPDDILAKVDRASMAVGLETRAPLLDHRVVEFALRLPARYKLRDGSTKWLLRALLDRHIPRSLVGRQKMGFVMPMASWLRGPLEGWARDLVERPHDDAAAFIDLARVRRMLDRHARGVGDFHQPLATTLMFLAWLEHARPAPAASASRVPTVEFVDALA